MKAFGTTLIVAASIVAFYIWTSASTGSPFQLSRIQTGYYNLLSDGFLDGHLYLKLRPPTQLLALPDPFDPVANARYRVNDLSLYHGRYHLYFGPVPVLTLFLPWRQVTRKDLPEDLAALIYVTVGYVFSLLTLRLLLLASGLRSRAILGAAAAAVLGLGEYGAVVLRNPNVYGVAVAAGYCFFSAGMYCFARLLLHGRPNRWLATMAGVCIGLTPGCRPHYALAALILCAAYIYYLGGLRPQAAWFVSPIAIAGALLLWYNFARFGNPLEFGTSYQLTAHADTRGVSLHLRNLAPGLYYLLLCPPRLWDQFPYIIARYVPPNPRFFAENAVGLLTLSPLASMGLALPFWIGRWKAARPTRLVLAALYGAATVLLIFICLTGFAVGRYLLDFAPALLIISMFGWFWCAGQSRTWLRRVAVTVIVAGGLWSAAVGAALSISFNDVLRDRAPRLFQTLARWSGQSGRGIRLPVEGLTMAAGVRFRSQPGNIREGLLASGRPGAEDCLVVEYAGTDRVRFGLEKRGADATFGPPQAITPGQEYQLGVWYGSSRQLVVSLDGTTVFSVTSAFYPTSVNEIVIGRGPDGMPDVHPFSGELRVPSNGGALYAAGQSFTFK